MYTISREVVEEALYEAEYDPEDYDSIIYEKYSGRCMYGEECFGIVGYDDDLLKFSLSLAKLDEDAREWLPNVKSDGMGRRTIYYWPSVKVSFAD